MYVNQRREDWCENERTHYVTIISARNTGTSTIFWAQFSTTFRWRIFSNQWESISWCPKSPLVLISVKNSISTNSPNFIAFQCISGSVRQRLATIKGDAGVPVDTAEILMLEEGIVEAFEDGEERAGKHRQWKGLCVWYFELTKPKCCASSMASIFNKCIAHFRNCISGSKLSMLKDETFMEIHAQNLPTVLVSVSWFLVVCAGDGWLAPDPCTICLSFYSGFHGYEIDLILWCLSPDDRLNFRAAELGVVEMYVWTCLFELASTCLAGIEDRFSLGDTPIY